MDDSHYIEGIYVPSLKQALMKLMGRSTFPLEIQQAIIHWVLTGNRDALIDWLRGNDDQIMRDMIDGKETEGQLTGRTAANPREAV